MISRKLRVRFWYIVAWACLINGGFLSDDYHYAVHRLQDAELEQYL